MFSVFEIGVESGLIGKILELKETTQGVKYTNIGGWHSAYSNDIPTWFEWEIQTILSLLNNDYKLDKYWFNVNDKGNHNRWHAHATKNLVAVYYIKVPDKSGNIEFKDKKNKWAKSVQPTAGQVLVFPGTLEHRVSENLSDDLRISAALNLIKI